MKFWQRISPTWRFILIVFVASRIVLTLIGVLAREMVPPSADKVSILHETGRAWLDIWGVYDSEWYLRIANHWYPNVQDGGTLDDYRTYAFSPLYPALMRLLGWIGSPYIGGLIVSNAALLIAAWLLHRTVRLQADESTARRAVAMLFLWPTGFIFSGVYTEALFICLLIAMYYAARRDKWWLAGAFGFALTLTRPLGFFMLIPFAWEYFRTRSKNRPIRTDVLALLLIPAALGAHLAMTQAISDRWDSFFVAQSIPPWGRAIGNPLLPWLDGLLNGNVYFKTWAIVSGIVMAMLILARRKIGLTLVLIGSILMLVPLSSGLVSLLRYTTTVFPLFIALAYWTRRPRVEEAVMIALALLQGFCMALWTNAYYLLI